MVKNRRLFESLFKTGMWMSGLFFALTGLSCSSLKTSPQKRPPVYKSSQSISFDWPVDRATLTQKYRRSGRKRHWGIDLASEKGTRILAAEDGRVIYTGSGFRGYGKMLIIEHNEEWASLYSHFSKIYVKEGEWVTQGQVIGGMGATGNARGVHLHFEVRHWRKPIDPIEVLPQKRALTANL